MKVLIYTLEFLLIAGFFDFNIAGVLGSTIPQEEDISSEEDSRLMVQEFDYSDVNNLNIKPADMEIFVRKQCDKNGGPTAFNSVVQSVESVVSCLQPIISAVHFEVMLRGPKLQDQVSAVFKELCPVIPTIGNCTQYLKEPVKSCVKPEERKAIDITYNMMRLILEFLCEDLERSIAIFSTTGGQECVKSKLNDLMKCENHIIQKYSDPDTDVAEGWNLQNYENSEDCNNLLNNYQLCTVKVMQKCRDQTFSKILDSLWNFVKSKEPCENWIDLVSP